MTGRFKRCGAKIYAGHVYFALDVLQIMSAAKYVIFAGQRRRFDAYAAALYFTTMMIPRRWHAVNTKETCAQMRISKIFQRCADMWARRHEAANYAFSFLAAMPGEKRAVVFSVIATNDARRAARLMRHSHGARVICRRRHFAGAGASAHATLMPMTFTHYALLLVLSFLLRLSKRQMLRYSTREIILILRNHRFARGAIARLLQARYERDAHATVFFFFFSLKMPKPDIFAVSTPRHDATILARKFYLFITTYLFLGDMPPTMR